MSEEKVIKSIFTKCTKKHYPIFCINEINSSIDGIKYACEAIQRPLYDPAINHEIIKEIDIPLPLLTERRRILL